VSHTFGWYTEVPGEPINAERGMVRAAGEQGHDLHRELPNGERYVVGYREQRGQGSIVCLGLTPSPAIVVGLHRWLDVPIASRSVATNVSTALFQSHDGTRFLIAVNSGDEDRIARIELRESPRQATDLFTGASWPVSGALGVPLAARNGTALRLD
jgi:hypothetical protein